MILDDALHDLGVHLDVPQGGDLVDRVIAQLEAELAPDIAGDDSGSTAVAATPAPVRRTDVDHQWLLVAAAALVALVVALGVLTPTREAIADWLGIGTVEVRLSPTALTEGAAPVPGGLGGQAAGVPGISVDAARDLVDFPLAVPTSGDRVDDGPIDVSVDLRPPGRLVALVYPDFTLVEVASAPGDLPTIVKNVDPASPPEEVTVGSSPGLWISGEPHEVSYRDQNGDIQIDTVRRAGNVLLWADDGVTYRIEGLDDLDAAQEIAGSLAPAD